MAAIAATTGLAELQGYARWLGRLFTGIAALMTFSFGFSLGGDSTLACWLIGIGLAAVTVLVSILLNFVDIAYRSESRQIAFGLLAFWGVCVAVEYFSHVGFTVGHRTSDVQAASLTNTAYDDKRAALDDARKQQAFYLERIASIEKSHSWASSKTADAWRAAIANAEGDFLFKRSKQCSNVTAPDSRSHCDKLAEYKANLAVAEDYAKGQAMLAAARDGLSKARNVAIEAKKGDSHVYSQTAMVAQIATGSLAPTATAMQWAGIGIGAFISLVFSFAGTVCNFLALRDWGGRPGIRTLPHAPASPPPRAVLPAAPAPNLPAPQPVVARAEPTVVEKIRNMRSLVTFSGHAIPLRS